MTTESYIYESLVSCGDPSFGEFYRIYTESIPLREQKPETEISAMAARPDYKILLLKKSGTVIGFSVLFIPAGESFCLLEYMAVHSAFRNKGCGRELFLRTFHKAFSSGGAVCGLLEVDSEGERSRDRETRRRRVRFYRSMGCLRIEDLSYILPLPGEGPPPQMDLMAYLPDSRPLLDRCELERWLRVIYEQVYCCSPDDSRIGQMLKDIDEEVKVW